MPTTKKKNKTRKKHPQNIPHPFNWSGFCTLDAFHIRIRNDCSEQVCAKSSKQVCVKIFFLKNLDGRFSWHLDDFLDICLPWKNNSVLSRTPICWRRAQFFQTVNMWRGSTPQKNRHYKLRRTRHISKNKRGFKQFLWQHECQHDCFCAGKKYTIS